MSSTRIARIETITVELPTRREHKWTGLTEPIGRYVLTRMTDDAGNVGWGEAPALKDWGGEFGRYFGESPAIVELVIERYLAPAVSGADPGNIVDLHRRMDAVIKGYPYAKCAVELAAYDLAGRRAGMAVHALLGGHARDRIAVTHSIGLIGIPEAEAETAKVAAEGIRTIKIKVGVDSRRDVEIVRVIRNAVGPDVELCVDANEGYRTPGEAIRTVRQMEPFGIKYFEQPVMGIERIAEVARAIDTPVMADESAWNAHDVVQIIERRAAQIVSIYTTKPGGLYRAMEVAAVCRAAGIICNVNGSVETGIGNRANIQLAAAAEVAVLSCVVPVSTPAQEQRGQIGGIYYKDDLLVHGMKLIDGAIELPAEPGMGIAVDEAKVEKYRVKTPTPTLPSPQAGRERRGPASGEELEAEMRKDIIDRQVAAMKSAGLDALISCSPENFAYATGFVVPSQPLMRHRHAMVVVAADGRTGILGVDMEATTIRTREPATPTHIWAEFTDDAMAVLARMLNEMGLAHAKIAIEMDYLPAGDMARLLKALPQARFSPSEGILARARQIKTREEIELLHRLSRIADQSITDALAAVRLGSSEMDIAAALTRNVYALGAEHFKLLIVATGERSQLPNVGPSERRLERADVCRVEIFSVISGYQAGVCRTAVVQEAPPHAERIWAHLIECKYLIMDMIKPGASCRAIYDAFIRKLSEMNLPPISFVGHGIGLFLHEDPYLGKTPVLGKTEDAQIEAGMVLGFEPLCYQTGHGFGMQNKDMLLVTETGCELLSDYANTDKLLVIK